MKTTFIYALCEPGTRKVRYIGKADEPEKRLSSHLRTSVKQKSHLGHWLRLLISGGRKPTLIILREVPYAKHAEIEMRYIRVARTLGIPLVNNTAGGEGCSNPTLETRSKMGCRGNKNPMFGKTGAKCPFFRESHPMFGKKQTSESNAKRSYSQSGEKHYGFGGHLSDEHKATLSVAQKARWARKKERDQEIEWALAPYLLE